MYEVFFLGDFSFMDVQELDTALIQYRKQYINSRL